MATKVAHDEFDEGVEYPRSWIWDEDGDRVSGRFASWSRGRTEEYGPKVILVLDVDGEQRSVWLLQTALESRLREECEQRPGRNLDAGEQVVIVRGEKKTGKNGREYQTYRVLFPDRPPMTAEDAFGGLFGPPTKTEDPDEEPGSQPGPDGAIPF